MAAGVNILLKRKAGAFTGGDLAAGELGVDTSNDGIYGSGDGTTVFKLARKADLGFLQQDFTQVSHGFSARDVVSFSTTWAKADADTAADRVRLAGVVSAVDGDEFTVVFRGTVGGFTGLTVGATYYTSTTAGGVSTTVSNRLVGVAISTTEIFVGMGMPTFASGDVVQKKVVPYVPTAAQSLTTTFADVDGSSLSFEPCFGSGVSAVRYSFAYQISGDTTKFLMHERCVVDGTTETKSEQTIYLSEDVEAGTFQIYEYSRDSWGSSPLTIKMQAREYLGSYGVKLHETNQSDGTGTDTLVTATLTVEEVMT